MGNIQGKYYRCDIIKLIYLDGNYLRKLEIYNGKLLKCEIYQEKWKKEKFICNGNY